MLQGRLGLSHDARGHSPQRAQVYIFMVSMSRLYLGVHSQTDVVGGWCLGAACLAASLVIAGPLERAVLRSWLCACVPLFC